VNDLECVDLTLKAMHEMNDGLIIVNFIQFDMDWGHRNDIEGFNQGLIEIDQGIERIIEKTDGDDLLFITADHGNDPTTASTDHSREYVPILVLTAKRTGTDLGTRKTFSDLAKTIACYLDIEGIKNGQNFLDACLA